MDMPLGLKGQAAAPRGTRKLVAPELLGVLEMFPSIDMTDEGVAAMRQMGRGMLSGPELPPELAAVRREERYVPGPDGAPDVRVLVYSPADAATARPALLHIHGGGYVIGTPEINDRHNRALVRHLGCVVVSVDYRLAPETRYPGAVEDCHAALVWLHSEASALGVDAARIAITGESAGGGHAAALALLARERGQVPICLVVLDSPMLDDRTGSTTEPHSYCGEFVWTPGSNRFGWRALMGVEPGGADTPVGAVPARVEDLGGLPPTFIAVGALDVLAEEGMEYARRLMRAGVPTELHVIPGAYHGFSIAGDAAPQVQMLDGLRRGALARAFGAA